MALLRHGVQHGLAVLGILGRDVLLEIVRGHRKLYCARARAGVFDASKSAIAWVAILLRLAVFVIAGKIGTAIDLVRQGVKFAHTCMGFIGGLVQPLPNNVLGFGPPTLSRADGGPQFQLGK